MNGSLLRKRLPIGLDLSGKSFRAVQMSERMGERRVEAALVLPREDASRRIDREELAMLRGALDRHGFEGDDIVLAVPRTDMMQEISEFSENVTTDEVEAAFIEEFARVGDCDPDRIELSWWELPDNSGRADTVHVLAAACSHEDAEELLAMFDDVGLEVVGIDLDASALTRVLGPLLPKPTETEDEIGDGFAAAVSLDWHTILVTVFDRNTIVYQRPTLDHGLRSVAAALEHQAGVEDELCQWLMFTHGFAGPPEDWEVPVPVDMLSTFANSFDMVINEIVMSLSYVVRQFPENPINRLFLCGDGVAVPGLPERMTDLLQIPTTAVPMKEMQNCRPTVDLCASSGQLAIAAGLAAFAA